ncbi:MAG: molybdenum cofactor biosynthesis protein MoaE [Desulfamplus sp.]|nr:molybdenum cofactor biosynthesis protein MoaE [Desulfamplus sp.]
MGIEILVEKIKSHPDFSKVGMVLYHNGVVRATTREGAEVTGLSVKVDYGKLDEIVAKGKSRPGIVEILVEIFDDRPLNVGEDVMYIAVAGDIRENVISALTDTLDRIKSEATSKLQFMKQ